MDLNRIAIVIPTVQTENCNEENVNTHYEKAILKCPKNLKFKLCN